MSVQSRIDPESVLLVLLLIVHKLIGATLVEVKKKKRVKKKTQTLLFTNTRTQCVNGRR